MTHSKGEHAAQRHCGSDVVTDLSDIVANHDAHCREMTLYGF